MKKIILIFLTALSVHQLFAEEIQDTHKGKEITETRTKDAQLATNFTASMGDSLESIRLKWKTSGPGIIFSIYRSTFIDGPYEEIGEGRDGIFDDKDAHPGIKYWYRLYAAEDNMPVFFSDAVHGYRKLAPAKSENIDSVIQNKKRERALPENKNQKIREESELKVLQKFHMNQVKLSLIIYTGGIYLKRGDLLLLRDFDDCRINYPMSELNFIKKDRYAVKFYSKKFFRFIDECRKAGAGKDLMNRLLANSMLYCIYTGESEVTGTDGMTLVIPSYEALGMSTEYFKDYREWRSNTIMIGSSNKKLTKMMQEAQSRRQDE